MTIPFLDLSGLHESIEDELRAAMGAVIEQSAFVGGAAVKDFEASFALAHEAAGAAGCGSGTDALALALRALGVGPGDEVVVPSMTFVATAEAVVHVGATPVVADVDPESLLLTPAGVAAVRTDRTRAVIPVHLYGHVVPFEHLRVWRDAGLVVVEDAAQAHLATDGGRFVGTVGHAACFSFYPGKNLGALGDGGMVISSDSATVDEVRRRRDHGRTSKYHHDVVGWCSRLDGLQAAVLDVKLRHLPEWTRGRRRAADLYRELLGADRLVPWDEGAVHHLLVARFERRDQVQERLRELGIGTGIHYPVPLSQQPWLVEAGAVPSPNAERAAEEILSLPMDPRLTDDAVRTVCDAVAQVLAQD